MELAELFQRLGTALGFRLLVGLQRERAGSRLAGFRTFPLVTVLGALCALLRNRQLLGPIAVSFCVAVRVDLLLLGVW